VPLTGGPSHWFVQTWPPGGLPHPRPMRRGFAWTLDRGGAFVRDEDSVGEVRSDRYDEIYLQLSVLELADERAVLRFVNDFDVFEMFEPFVDAELAGSAIRRAPYPKLSAYPGFDDVDEYDERTALLEESREARRLVQDLPRIDVGAESPAPTIHEFRWAVRCLRDLTRAYRCLAEARPASDFEWENPMLAYDAAQQRGGERGYWTGDEIEEFVADTLAIGLRGYGPTVAFRPDLQPREPGDWEEYFPAGIDLWATCCLELFNHIAEGATYKECANERCQRPFVRQIGRSLYGQRRRTGVRFCSHSCARAKAQRGYQQRKREKSQL
jgi:hypothetical protein